MKHTLLAIALLSSISLAACSKPAADTTAEAPMPATDAPADAAAMPAAAPAPAADTSADAGMPMQNPMVGGAPMYADKDIVDNAVTSKDHTTLVAAVKAAGLVDTLKGAGPFTVFAPTNAAFDKLPKGTVDTLLKPDKKADLTKVLTYHVVPGKLDAASLKQQIAAGNGTATLKTVQGETLTAKDDGNGGIVLTDAKGGMSHVTTADVMQKNGVIHVVDTVLMP
jgi:uncharacterized surface protein with fasciclin (FAS1) repeats